MPPSETIGITGGGGRCSAVAHAYSLDPDVQCVFGIPGNDLMDLNLREDVSIQRFPAAMTAANARLVAELFRAGGVTIADVCEDAMIEGGLVDHLQEMGIPVVGPTKAAGRLEWDKAWARAFMAKYGIPHPEFQVFDSPEAGIAFVRSRPDQKWVIKACGLVAGKGVIVAANRIEAEAAILSMQAFGPAGTTYLIEQCLGGEKLKGEEFSTFVVCGHRAEADQTDYQLLGSAQDHKRLLDGDRGPNTGGMGCVSSPLVVTPDVMRQTHDILRRTLDGLAREGCPYTGVLYFGGMVVGGKVYCIEFNARWGDPEAQVLLPGVKTSMVEIARAVIERRIDRLRIEVDGKVRVAVVVASEGYPGDYSAVNGTEIFGIENARKQPGVLVYPAGVALAGDGRHLAQGGRLLAVVGEGDDVLAARARGYAGAREIRVGIDAKQGRLRGDIGHRDVERLAVG